MNFLHVISGMDPKGGGVAQAVRLYIKGDTSETNVHEVASCDSPDADWLGRDPFPIHALGPGKYGYAYSPRLLPWLIDNLPRFDAVIIHGLWLWPGIATHVAMRKLETGKLQAEMDYAPGAAKKHEADDTDLSSLKSQLSALSSSSQVSMTKRPRLFVMPHGMLDPYFQRAPERRVKAIRNWIYWKLIEHRVVKNADGLLFTCEEEMRLAREPFRPYRPKAEKVVGLGTEEPPPYTPAMREALAAACPGLGDQPYILFLGRIHPKKGVNMLIRAYANLKLEIRNLKPETTSQVSALRSHPSAQLPALVIAGPCHDPEYLRKLKAESGTLKPETISQVSSFKSQVSPTIHFVEMVTGDAKWGALYGCEAFILPSHQENFGIAVAEALACNKPVLISNKVNIWREIEADGAGLVEDDTDEGTANLLRRFLTEWTKLSESNSHSTDTNSVNSVSKVCFKKRFSIEQAAESLRKTLQNHTF